MKKGIIIIVSIIVVVGIGITIYILQKPPVNKGSDETTNIALLSKDEINKLFIGRQVFINESCELNPKILNVLDGTVVLFKNNSSSNKAIKLMGQDFIISANESKQIKLTGKKIPTTLYLSCDKNSIAGRINLLKMPPITSNK